MVTVYLYDIGAHAYCFARQQYTADNARIHTLASRSSSVYVCVYIRIVTIHLTLVLVNVRVHGSAMRHAMCDIVKIEHWDLLKIWLSII